MKAKILAWDLENSPILSWHWGRWNQNIAPVQTVQESRVLCFGAKWLHTGEYIFKAEYEHGRTEMLETIRELLTEADGVLSWNGKNFDTKKINREFILEGMTPPAPYVEIDLLRVAKQRMSFSSNRLDAVAQELGVGRKVKHEGFELWLKVMAGDEKARALFKRYQKQDVLLLEKLYKKFLPWIPASLHPNAALLTGKLTACPRCASTQLQSRGYAYTQASVFRRYQCQSCGHWPRVATRLNEFEKPGTTTLRSA